MIQVTKLHRPEATPRQKSVPSKFIAGSRAAASRTVVEDIVNQDLVNRRGDISHRTHPRKKYIARTVITEEQPLRRSEEKKPSTAKKETIPSKTASNGNSDSDSQASQHEALSPKIPLRGLSHISQSQSQSQS